MIINKYTLSIIALLAISNSHIHSSITTKKTFWIQEENKKKVGEEVKLKKFKNLIGSRTPFYIDKGRFLMLPQGTRNDFDENKLSNLLNTYPWKERVKGEVMVANKLRSLGICTTEPSLVSLYKNNTKSIGSAYTCLTFKELKKRKRYVINPQTSLSMWKKSYFKGREKEYELKVQAWEPILNPLFEDVCKAVKAGLSRVMHRRSLNVVIIKQKSNKTKYVARWLGFNFIFNRGDRLVQVLSQEKAIKSVKSAMSSLLETVLWEEYNYRTNKKNTSLSKEYEDFLTECENFYLKKFSDSYRLKNEKNEKSDNEKSNETKLKGIHLGALLSLVVVGGGGGFIVHFIKKKKSTKKTLSSSKGSFYKSTK